MTDSQVPRQLCCSVVTSLLCQLLFLLPSAAPIFGQSQAAPSAPASVPRLVKFSGVVPGNLRSGVVGITFALYKEEQGGAPLWLETQNVQADSHGHYTVYLGATKSDGLPQALFVTGEARWLGVQLDGQTEQARTLLLSVPYALKAGDAETVGGLPASAFMLAVPGPIAPGNGPSVAPCANCAAAVVSGSGTPSFIPMWTGSSILGNSVIFQSEFNNAGAIGINTTSPQAALDVNGNVLARGELLLPGTGTATAAQGFPSQPLDAITSVYNSTVGPQNQDFRWQAEPVGNNTSAPSGKLNLLFGGNGANPGETGLSLSSTGLITFAPAQTFPGTGTITGVTAGTDLVGGGSSGNVTLNVDTTKVVTGVIAGTDLIGGGTGGTQTLNLDTTKVPQLAAANTFTGNQTVNGNLTSTGVVTASSYQIGSNLFAFGSIQNENAFLGFAGNATTTGVLNTASGVFALFSNTTGSDNTASGAGALQANSTGNDNTATGSGALFRNTTGIGNTASGANALVFNTTGGTNTASGDDALELNTTGESNTASGAQALYHNNGDYNTGSGLNALGNNTTGSSNTASGVAALINNTTGDSNTALGASAGPDSAHPGLSNSTAIGANAEVTASNAMVLGSINGVNGATADTFVGIGTTAPAAKLDVHGNANFTGPVTFAPGQTFPGTGTITGVTAGTDLIGGGSSGGVTLSLDTTKVPQLNVANTFTGDQTVNGKLTVLGNQAVGGNQTVTGNQAVTGNQTVTGSLTATGNLTTATFVSANIYQIGNNPFAFGSTVSANAFLGFAGNFTTTATASTGVGYSALAFATAGVGNTAVGGGAMINTSGGSNTALGVNAGDPTTSSPITGSNNTFLGAATTPGTQTSLNNATAIGANAEVTASNAMVLGSINGINNATADTSVGIGTTTPSSTLDVEATAPGLVGPAFLLKNKAPVQAGLGNSVDLRFALDGGSSVGNPNAFIRVAEDGNNQYGAWISFDTMADGGSGQGALERMRIRSDGFVGIGTAIPDALLSVNGGADKVGGGSWGTYSDGRLKNLDGDFQAGLNEVLKLHPVRYRYKEGNGMGINDRDQHIGFVAQEVKKVIPEAVSENSKGYLLVNNDPILWTMLNAIKQQQREFQQQQAELAKALRQIKQQQSVLRAQAAAMRSLKAEVRETRETLRKVKVQGAATEPALVATK